MKAISVKWLIVYKIIFSLLGFSAVVTEMAVLIERGTFNPINFLSYFTVQNNILVSFVLLLSALALASGEKHRGLDTLRGFSTVYILVVGVGFSILLAGLEGVALTAVPWDNTVLHYIIPVAVLIDYLIDRPQAKLHFKQSLVWLLFPVAYLIYSLVRGAVTNWYPYPFLNPTNHGYDSVAITSIGLSIVTVAIIWFVTRLSAVGR